MEAREKSIKLDAMVELFKNLAHDEIKSGAIDPKVLALLEDGSAVGGPFPSGIIPDHMISDIANDFFKHVNAVAAVFSSEAWMLRASNEKDFDEEVDKYGGRIKNHPDRVEIAFVVGGFDGHIEFHSFKIIREEDKEPYLEKIDEESSDHGRAFSRCFEGVFLNPNDTIGDTIGTA